MSSFEGNNRIQKPSQEVSPYHATFGVKGNLIEDILLL